MKRSIFLWKKCNKFFYGKFSRFRICENSRVFRRFASCFLKMFLLFAFSLLAFWKSIRPIPGGWVFILFCKNIQIIPLIFILSIHPFQSLASRGYVKEQFAWRHYYFYLLPEGIVYLREYLGLPEDVVCMVHYSIVSNFVCCANFRDTT